MTKLSSSSLPKDYDDDGLASLNQPMVMAPLDHHVVIAVVDCKSITTDTDTGLQNATARVLRIEPLQGREAEMVMDMLEAAKDRRLGGKQLSIVDFKTGELHDDD